MSADICVGADRVPRPRRHERAQPQHHAAARHDPDPFTGPHRHCHGLTERIAVAPELRLHGLDVGELEQREGQAAGAFLAFNAPDPDYRLVAAADGATEALTTDGTGRWYSTPPASARWITSANNANGTAARTASGDYTFEVDIDTTGVILTAPGLVLVVAAVGDDTMAIDINGTEVHAASAPTILWEPDRFTFAASSLTDGLNTVRFRVNNGALTTGLFVDELALEQQ